MATELRRSARADSRAADAGGKRGLDSMRKVDLIPLFFPCFMWLASGCEDEDPALEILPVPGSEECTPESAGITGARRLEFEHFVAPAGCVLDPVGRRGSCTISGCSVADVILHVGSETDLRMWLDCSAAGAIEQLADFASSQMIFVRQGMRLGEAMSATPVAWLAEVGGEIHIGEKRYSLCIADAATTADVVSYAIVYPRTVSSTLAIDHRFFRRPGACDCEGEECS